MQLVQEKITLAELEKMAAKMFQYLVKAVVDVEKNIMVIDADFHAKQEQFLLESGSQQENLWGINLHPDQYGTLGWIEFDSIINLRPSWGNRTRGIDNPDIQNKIRNIVNKSVQK